MGFVIEVVFGFEYATFARDSTCSATSASRSFYTQGVDFRFGVHKVETIYIPSNQV
jgi:hypothetical protein